MSLLLGFILSIFFEVDTEYGIGILTRKCRDYFIDHLNNDKQEHMGYGTVLMIAFCIGFFVLAVLILALAGTFSKILWFVLETVMFSVTLKVGRGAKEAVKAYKDGMTDETQIKNICRNIAEALNDNIIAPIIFMALGGASLAVLYRTAVSVKKELAKEEHYAFNRFAVRVYDIVNFIPQRLTAVLVLCACRIWGYNYTDTIDAFWNARNRNDDKMIPSIFESALGIKLYGHSDKFSDYMNENPDEQTSKIADREDIKKSLKIESLAAAVMLVIGLLARFSLG